MIIILDVFSEVAVEVVGYGFNHLLFCVIDRKVFAIFEQVMGGADYVVIRISVRFCILVKLYSKTNRYLIFVLFAQLKYLLAILQGI